MKTGLNGFTMEQYQYDKEWRWKGMEEEIEVLQKLVIVQRNIEKLWKNWKDERSIILKY